MQACPENAVSSSEQLSGAYRTGLDTVQSTPLLPTAESAALTTAFRRAIVSEQKTLKTTTPRWADKRLVRRRGAQHLRIHKELVKNWEPTSYSDCRIV